MELDEEDSPLVRRLYPFFGDRKQGSSARAFIFENGLGARFSPGGGSGALASCPSPTMTIRSGLYQLDFLVQALGHEGVKSIGVVNARVLLGQQAAKTFEEERTLEEHEQAKMWDSWPGGWAGSWGMTTEGAIFAEGKRVADANGGEGVVVRPGDILTVVVNTDEGDAVLLSTGAVDIRANFGYVSLSFKVNGKDIPDSCLSNVPSPLHFAAGADGAPFQLVVHRFRSNSTAAIQHAQHLALQSDACAAEEAWADAVGLLAQAVSVSRKGGGALGTEYAGAELRERLEHARERQGWQQQLEEGDALSAQAEAAIAGEEFFEAAERIREARACFHRGGPVGATKVRLRLRLRARARVRRRIPSRSSPSPSPRASPSPSLSRLSLATSSSRLGSPTVPMIGVTVLASVARLRLRLRVRVQARARVMVHPEIKYKKPYSWYKLY